MTYIEHQCSQLYFLIYWFSPLNNFFSPSDQHSVTRRQKKLFLAMAIKSSNSHYQLGHWWKNERGREVRITRRKRRIIYTAILMAIKSLQIIFLSTPLLRQRASYICMSYIFWATTSQSRRGQFMPPEYLLTAILSNCYLPTTHNYYLL